MNLPSGPLASKRLMQLTWVAWFIGFWGGFGALQNGNTPSAIEWISVWVVGGVGLLSFLRHAVFHRSDAKRMNWDYGQRNDFQIEAGFANLSWGLVGLISWLQGWGIQAQGAVILVFGIYMSQAAILHLSEFNLNDNRGKNISKLINIIFAACLLCFGSLALLYN